MKETMKILLVNAPSRYSAVTTADWDTTAEDIGAFPPIGLSYLAGYILKNSKYELRILDTLAERLSYDQIKEKISKINPDVVGITAFTPSFYDVLKTARIAKKLNRDCYVCLGGSHVSEYPDETIAHSEIDFLVHGEGEEIFLNLLNALDGERNFEHIKGISYKVNGYVKHNLEKGYFDDINLLPSPAFELLPIEKYKSAIGTGKTVGTIASSRGCPYECTYCNRPYRSYRSYNNDRIISEMDFFYKRRVKEFVFFDDMFNINPKRVIKISEAIEANFRNIVWSFRGRVDQVSEEMILKAKKSGCRQIMFGVEAATDEDLKAIKKKITTKQVVESINLCKKHGLETSTNWIIGLPTHRSQQDILNLLDFAIKTRTDYAQFNILIPYEGTKIFSDGLKNNILPKDFWRSYVKEPTPNAYIPIWEEYISRSELSELLKICYRKFYLRPSRIFNQVMKLKSFAQFGTKFKGVTTVLGFGGFRR
jgi:anaerobic magnesium-protoporphyrin IX monomethyl ester cyclase